LRNEEHGRETVPTHYWHDRREDGPTYHIDFFLPREWLAYVTHFEVGRFVDWCGNGLSDHVPIVVEVNV
jgi:exodeoxyribonuclease-3